MTEVLKYSLVESALNTFTEFEKMLEDEIGVKRRTRNKGSKTKVMHITEIVLEFPGDGYLENTDDDEFEFQITTQSETAMVAISDKDCFFKCKLQNAPTKAQGSFQVVSPMRIPCDLWYFKKTMYMAVKGTSLAGAGTLGVELHFNYSYVSDWQLQRMISRKV